MEQAYFIENQDQLNTLPIGSPYSRVYFGEEFCENRMPAFTELQTLYEHIKSKGLDCTLVTPLVTDAGLERIQTLVSMLATEDEVVVNDLGVLHVLNQQSENTILIGRILSRHMLRSMYLQNSTEANQAYLSLFSNRLAYLEVDAFNPYLLSENIASVIPLSFYEGPFVWSLTRRCAYYQNHGFLKKFTPHPPQCKGIHAIIENTEYKKQFLLEGNHIKDLAYTYVNELGKPYFSRNVRLSQDAWLEK